MIGFTTPYLIPHHVIQDIIKVLSEFTLYENSLYATLIKIFSETSSLFRHTGLVLLERKGTDGVKVCQIQQGFFAHPWGLSPPSCPCGIQNLTIYSKWLNKGKDIVYIVICKDCGRRTKLTQPPHAEKVEGSKNLWIYPWPQKHRDFWLHIEWVEKNSSGSSSGMKRKDRD